MQKQRLWTAAGLAAGLIVSSCLVGFLHSAAVADTAQESARTAIQAALDRRNAAAARLDFDGYWSVRTANFYWISKNGERKNIDQLKAAMGRMMNAAESIKGQSFVEKVNVRGNTALVVVRDAGTVVIRMAANKKNVIKSNGRYSSVWIKQGSRWLESQEKVISSHLTLNSKPVD